MNTYYYHNNSISNLLVSMNSFIIKDVFENLDTIKVLISYDINTIIKTFENFFK